MSAKLIIAIDILFPAVITTFTAQMKIFRRLLEFSRPYHHYVPEYIVYIVLFTIFGILNFAMIIPLLDFLFQENSLQPIVARPEFSLSAGYFIGLFKYYAWQFSHGGVDKYRLLLFVTIILVIVTLLKNLFGYLSQKVLVRMRVNLVRNIRNKIFEKLSHTSLSFYQHRQKGQLLSTISSDVTEIEGTVVNSIQVLLRDPLAIIATFAVLFYISAKLTLFTLILFPLSGYIISVISKRLKRQSVITQSLLGSLMTYTDEVTTGNRIVKIFNAERFVNKRFRDMNADYTHTMKSMMSHRELASPLSEVMGVMVISAIVLYGGKLILDHNSALTASQFMGYLGLYFSILGPAKNIGNAISSLQRGLVSGERVFQIIDEPETILEAADARPVSTFADSIRFEHVCFNYNEHIQVLHDINFTMDKGKTIALVGESGAGKSTIADLLPRLYDTGSGRILLDGVDIRQVKMHDLRSLISMVSQEAILFNDTVYNNIVFGMEGSDSARVEHAARVANAHDFIINMEHGYDTIIGDRGMKLSGGQRQRLTIARAIYKNAPIIILDEATSALDTESEKLVQEAIKNMLQDKTSLVIAHRLSTIRDADLILVLQQGKIMESGTHRELLERQGYYHKLVQMQEIG